MEEGRRIGAGDKNEGRGGEEGVGARRAGNWGTAGGGGVADVVG